MPEIITPQLVTDNTVLKPCKSSPSSVPTRKLSWYSYTRTGRRGGVNQDAVLALHTSFFGVADGVGGGVHGEVASRVALDCSSRIPFADKAVMFEELKGLDKSVAAAIAELSQEPGATTLAALWLESGKGVTAHCGDSRIYRLQRGWQGKYRFELLTMDHTYHNLALQTPEHGQPDDPALMLGLGHCHGVSVQEIRVKNNDLFILCTDGLHRFVADKIIAGIIIKMLKKGSSLEAICKRLAERAMNVGSDDDISIVMVRADNGLTKKYYLIALVATLLALLPVLIALVHKVIAFSGGW